MIKHITLFLGFLLLTSLVHAKGEVLLSPKYGYVKWSDNLHTIGGNTITFDSGYQGAFGFEGGYLFNFGLAVTGEIGGYSVNAQNETAGPLRGKASIGWMNVIVTQYFRREQVVQPYIGVGLGNFDIEIDNSNTNAKLDGNIIQARAGVLFNVSRVVNLNLEYKYFRFDVNDVNNLEIKSNANYLGVAVVARF